MNTDLLLAAHWDAVFDAGLVSFDDDGSVLFKPDLDPAVMELLERDQPRSLALTDAHCLQLTWHRHHFGFTSVF